MATVGGAALQTAFDLAGGLSGNNADLLASLSGTSSGGKKKTKKSPLELLAAVIAGDTKVKKLDKAALKKLANIDLSKITYTKKGLAKLGLTKKDLEQSDLKGLKQALRGILQDDKITKSELKGFKKETKSVLETAAFTKLETKADNAVPELGDQVVVPGLNQAAGRDIDVTGFGTIPLSFFGNYAAGFKRRRLSPTANATRLGDSGYGQSLTRATVLGG